MFNVHISRRLPIVYFACIILVSPIFFAPKTSIAMEVRFVEEAVFNCGVEITGVIQNGDLAILKPALEKLKAKYPGDAFEGNLDNYNHKRICLDSPGGSLSEALRIVEFLRGSWDAGVPVGWATAVPAGAECVSACAVIFLGGSREDMGANPDRILHPLGKLGFHAPSLNIPEGGYSARDVKAAYNVEIKAISRLLDIVDQIDVPMRLIVAMLKTPPEDMLYIDTVEKAAAWNIPVGPTIILDRLTEQSALHVCENLHNPVPYDVSAGKEYRYEYPAIPDDAPAFTGETSDHEDSQAYVIGFGQEHLSICKVNRPNKAGVGVWKFSNYFGYISVEGEGHGYFPASEFPGSTPLALLAPRTKQGWETVTVESDRIFSAQIPESAHCLVLNNGKVLDHEECQLSIHRSLLFLGESGSTPSHRETTLLFTWPSGSKSTVTHLDDLEAHSTDFLLNGNSLSDSKEAYSALNSASIVIAESATPDNGNYRCFTNPKSEKQFCFPGHHFPSHIMIPAN